MIDTAEHVKIITNTDIVIVREKFMAFRRDMIRRKETVIKIDSCIGVGTEIGAAIWHTIFIYYK